jgi:hypothetical protein
MKKAMILLSITSTLCLAETWTGKLVDATCAEKGKNTSPSAASGQSSKNMNVCTPKESTISFAIRTLDGRILKLDSTGNTLAADTFKANSKANKGEMVITITGTMTGDTVQVDSVNPQ